MFKGICQIIECRLGLYRSEDSREQRVSRKKALGLTNWHSQCDSYCRE